MLSVKPDATRPSPLFPLSPLLSPLFAEIERKLALPSADTAQVAQRLSRSPLVVRRKPTRHTLRTRELVRAGRAQQAGAQAGRCMWNNCSGPTVK